MVDVYVSSGLPGSEYRLSVLMSVHMSWVECCGSSLHCTFRLSGMHIYVAPSRIVCTVGVVVVRGISWAPVSTRVLFTLLPRLQFP